LAYAYLVRSFLGGTYFADFGYGFDYDFISKANSGLFFSNMNDNIFLRLEKWLSVLETMVYYSADWSVKVYSRDNFRYFIVAFSRKLKLITYFTVIL